MTATAESTHFAFFNLPRELRDLVYHFLWQTHPHQVVAYSNKKSILRYIACKKAHTEDKFYPAWTHTLPDWLFISKAFHAESLAVLLEHSEWTRFAGSHVCQDSGTSTLFGPGTAQVVALHDMVFGTDRLEPHESVALQARERRVEHSRVAQDMATRGHGRTLHVWLDLHGLANRRFRSLFHQDMEYLTCYQCVDIATLVVCVCNDGVYLRGTADPVDEIESWVRTAAGLVFGTAQPVIKYEWHDQTTCSSNICVDKKTTRHWYEFSRPALQM